MQGAAGAAKQGAAKHGAAKQGASQGAAQGATQKPDENTDGIRTPWTNNGHDGPGQGQLGDTTLGPPWCSLGPLRGLLTSLELVVASLGPRALSGAFLGSLGSLFGAVLGPLWASLNLT